MCYCGDNREFENCCKPIIKREKKAQTAQELMRSRYSAYVIADASYLLHSLSKESPHIQESTEIESFCASVTWLQLKIVEATENEVEFKAYYRQNSTINLLHERSSFVKEEGEWKYHDGVLYKSSIQRNETCPCGSGKKYKKCCL